ncbi:MAG: OadG family protein [Chthoniobacterales bacterium]|nr:OadG family protein [Chthoniobacterales bacterium]
MTVFPAFLAASLPEHPTFLGNLQYQITGLLVVLFTLGLLSLIVSAIGKVFIALDRRRMPGTAPSLPAATPAATSPGGSIPSPLFAVIAAAVSTALGDRRIMIHGVQVADPRENLAWGIEGRRSIYAGKNLR